MLLLGFLPLSALILTFGVLSTYHKSLGKAALDALIVWGVIIWFLSETLSPVRQLTHLSAVLSWSAINIGLVIFGAKRRISFLEKWERIKAIILEHRFFYFSVILIVAINLVVALIAPPSTWDSLTYHLARVANWVQNQSIAFYDTHIWRQNEMPPFPGLIILQFQLLTGVDRLANLAQWISQVGVLIGIYLLAGHLKLDSLGRAFSVVWVASMPLGIVEATSTQTDYVVALWLVIFVCYIFVDMSEKSPLNWLRIGLSLALALFSKPTAVFFALPFVAWYGIYNLRLSYRDSIKILSIVSACILVINGAFLYRLQNQDDASAPFFSANERFDMKVIISNPIKFSSTHISTIGPINDRVEEIIISAHDILNIDVNDPDTSFARFRLHSFNTHEDLTGNFILFLLTMVTILTLGVNSEARSNKKVNLLLFSIVLGYLLLAWTFKWSPYRHRYHLVLFALAGPPVTYVFMHSKIVPYIKHIGLVLLVASLPWLLMNSTRPLIHLPSASSGVPFFTQDSILTTPRFNQYFNHRTQSDFEALSEHLSTETDCRTVGLYTGENSRHYLVWVSLEQTGLDYEIVYSDGSFMNNACAIVVQERSIANMEGNIINISDDLSLVIRESPE